MTRPPSVDTSSGQQRSDAGATPNAVADRMDKAFGVKLVEAEMIRSLAARVETLEAVLRLFVDRMKSHGDWEDGCFYYSGISASELQEPLERARAALTPGAPS